MSNVRIYGASDDLIEVEGAIDDEFSTGSGEWFGVLSGPESGALLVGLRYGRYGWAITVSAADPDEDAAIPPWPMIIRPGNDGESSYSPTLVVDAPDGSTLTGLGAGRG